MAREWPKFPEKPGQAWFFLNRRVRLPGNYRTFGSLPRAAAAFKTGHEAQEFI
jgi:hypothetical protein